MARFKRRLLVVAVLIVMRADFIAVMEWRGREIDYITCREPIDLESEERPQSATEEIRPGNPEVMIVRCGGSCEAPIIKRRDARWDDWFRLAAYLAGNVVFGCCLWWLWNCRRWRDCDR